MIVPPLVANDPGRVLEKDARGGTLPLRIGRREMIADIAGAAGGKQRIGQRMQRDVGVGMTKQLLIMRNEHAAERHAIAVDELVHVIAVAGADIREAVSAQLLVGHGDIPFERQFDIVRRSLDQRHRHARPIRRSRRRR